MLESKPIPRQRHKFTRLETFRTYSVSQSMQGKIQADLTNKLEIDPSLMLLSNANKKRFEGLKHFTPNVHKGERKRGLDPIKSQEWDMNPVTYTRNSVSKDLGGGGSMFSSV